MASLGCIRFTSLTLARVGSSFSRSHRLFTGGSYRWQGRYAPWVSVTLSRSIMLAAVPTFLKSPNKGEYRPYRPILSDHVPIETARMMLPDDTNVMGNVHGGTILKLMEQAGHIVSMRHCNKKEEGKEDRPPLVTALARMNHTDFYQPMHVGEIAHVQAAVTYASKRSIEVTVDVWAENPLTGGQRHTNSARLWYVAVPANVPQFSKELHAQDVPMVTGLGQQEMVAGKERYEEQKRTRELEDRILGNEGIGEATPIEAEPGTANASATTLVNVVSSSDCLLTGHMMGGVLMKIMDTAGGICSAKHCKSLAVTACMDAVNFHTPILVGELVTTRAKVVFTSKRSLVIEVVCEAEGLRTGSSRVTSTAYFTFVSLDNRMKAQDVPPLKLTTDEERRKYDILQELYERKKEQRKKNATK